ncbi:MAG: DUF4129 domain-containing protein [Theionarchaea archaeon]|nr:DUF4129 domain-containing protein [Theionarchaea archaeon]MBU7000029.1 DUF4129 domain-containing protein [Theionarchaea archaeon]MBU7021673.1 DUF4129 domain-containing protein [Theionarchaea archaeon]MBU7034679.1 DUF4129 domain-containing protein [Theionarchaea archaeon]MBU7039340.1 DUF4129 domain-containing protein [Theionarchaea archaeon]
MKVAAVLLCIVVAFCVGSLASVLEMERHNNPLSAPEEEVSYHVQLNNVLLPLILTLWIVIILVSLTSRSKIKKQRLVDDSVSWLSTLGLALGLSLLLCVMYFTFRDPRTLESLLPLRRPMNADTLFSEPLIIRSPTTMERGIYYIGILILVLLIVLLIVAFIAFSMKRGYMRTSILQKIERERRKSFSFDGSHREIVINAYGASCDHLETRGFSFDKAKTATEVKEDLKDSNLEQLTYLFEKARYSHHTVTKQDSDQALAYYGRLKHEG